MEPVLEIEREGNIDLIEGGFGRRREIGGPDQVM
jgi:hypothetical protein